MKISNILEELIDKNTVSQPKDIFEQIYNDLAHLSLVEDIEILANLFIRLGLKEMCRDRELPAQIDTINITQIVLDDLEQYGERLSNSLVRQGLLLLSWLEEKEK